MLFNSLEFAIFFPLVTLLFFVLPHRFRWLLLLASSCFFYMFFKPIYILILLFTIVIDYYAGIWIDRTKDKRRRKLLLAASLVANIGVLAVFKYYNFLVENINIALHTMKATGNIPLLNILLPIGLSFHTFQAMSYTIEVYRGNQKPEKHFGIYALYVMFYPQLVAGPIERPQNILHQFHEEQKFSFANMRSGLILMAWGLFKKCVIADRLASFVNEVYGNPTQFQGISIIIATVFFAIQIFCDFSGYSDIAIGSARCMGFELMNNFDRPYQSTSIGEFWRRWHISLSTWFKDYLYIPLGGNRVSVGKRCMNLLIVFLISGLWHGANWTFIVWGALHGIYLIVELLIGKRNKDPKQLHWFTVLVKRAWIFILASFAWVFFRANTITDAITLIKRSVVGITEQMHLLFSSQLNARRDVLYLKQSNFEFLFAILFIGIMFFLHQQQKNKRFDEWLLSRTRVLRWSVYYVLIGSFVFWGVFNKAEFIYFQF